MKPLLILAWAVLLSGCASVALPFAAPTPRPTLSAIEVYLSETDDHMESMFVYTSDLTDRLKAEQKDATLFINSQWRDSVTKSLKGLRMEYQELQKVPPIEGTERYSAAVLAAEAHTDSAAQLLLAWLDDQDNTKYQQAMQELDAAKAGRDSEQAILDSLLKK